MTKIYRRPVAIAVAVVSLAGVAGIDLLLDSHISVMFFYLLPLTLTVILIGKKGGIACSICASAISLLDHFLSANHASTGILAWNAAMRLGILLVACFLIDYWWQTRQDGTRYS